VRIDHRDRQIFRMLRQRQNRHFLQELRAQTVFRDRLRRVVVRHRHGKVQNGRQGLGDVPLAHQSELGQYALQPLTAFLRQANGSIETCLGDLAGLKKLPGERLLRRMPLAGQEGCKLRDHVSSSEAPRFPRRRVKREPPCAHQ
jgi:hypothetical protein